MPRTRAMHAVQMSKGSLGYQGPASGVLGFRVLGSAEK